MTDTTRTASPAEVSPEASDDDVIARVRGGEVDLFEVVMRRYNQRVYRTVRAILRDEDETLDAMQLRATEFKRVSDVAAFVVKTMPPKAPGSLSADEYYAILAFDLKANGLDLGDKTLDAALASTLEIPRK